MAKKSSSTVLMRRLVQTIFVLLFFYLFLLTTYHPENVKGGPVGLFFNLDPLILFSVWLGGHAVASALLLSLLTIVVTLIFGRWFCGWVCPFGGLNHLFGAMWKRKGKEKVEAGRYSVWQKGKYYIVIVVILSALFGANLAGWLDPFSFFYRSMAAAIFPAVNALFQGFFDWMYNVNPLKLSAISEPIYDFMRRYFLMLGQPHYFWGMLLGILFGAVILLNFARSRFWCRYICPLGGLLGIFGKNPVVRVTVDAEKCTKCMACVSVCPTGAEPESDGSWRAGECIYCWNCEGICPVDAISFKFIVPVGGESHE